MNIHRAVALLVDRPKLRIQATPQVAYTVEAPCLLAQLHDAFASSSGGHGGRTVPGSRMPLNTAALELWTEIAADAAVWACVLGIDRARYRRQTSERQPPPVGQLLRAVAAAVVQREDRAAMAERITHNCRAWAGRIETMLAPDQASHRSLSGVTCRDCGATWVSDADDQPRLPALWVEYGETGVIRCLWCRACGAHTWRDELLQQAWRDDLLPRVG